MANEIKCSVCQKVIGRYVQDGQLNAGSFIGIIPMCHMQMDYRKAAHLHFGKGAGAICRKCARQKFPDGKVYYVMLNEYGKDMPIGGGTYGDSKYATREAAEIKCDEMNAKFPRLRYRVTEKKF